MENDQVFAVDADIDARMRKNPSLRYKDSQVSGVDALPSGTSRAASRKDRDYEDTPLLSRTDDDSTYVEGSDQDEGPSWSGERDFEGKPWWNKPSVRVDDTSVPGASTNYYRSMDRSSGYYRRSSCSRSHSEGSLFRSSTSSSP